MFIQTESTPNPNALKFLLDQIINNKEPVCIEPHNSKHGDLAYQLFRIGNIDLVFIGKDFITITKSANAGWEILKPQIVMTIMEYLMTGMPIVHDQDTNIDTNLTEIEHRIIELLETKIRPAVAGDGGDIVYKSFINGVVSVELRGACKGCPSSVVTLKRGVESMLKQYIPEVIEVVSEA